MAHIKDVKIGNNTYLVEPAVYAATAGTASAITAAINNFALDTGVIVTLKITTSNIADATLNVQNTGAKNIKYNNANIATGVLKENNFYSFIYDGTNWQLIGELDTWRGIQDNLTSSANTTESLSAKQGYLLANGAARDSTKVPLSGGTMTGQLVVTSPLKVLAQNTTDKGGEILLCGAPSYESGKYEAHLDILNNFFRIWSKDGEKFYLNLSSGTIGACKVPASIITGSLDITQGGTGANSPEGARTKLGLGTIATYSENDYVTINTAQTITGTKSWGASGAGGQLNGEATDGGINSIRVGNDVWLGDCNSSGILGIKSTGTNAGFFFYNSSSTQIGKLYIQDNVLHTNKSINLDTTYNASATNNGLSSGVGYPAASHILDSAGRTLVRLEGVINSNGSIGGYWYVRNYKTDGTQVAQKGIGMYLDKSGNLTYGISDPEKFRSALGLGTNAITSTAYLVSARVQADSPIVSSVNTAQTNNLDTTISLADSYGDIKNPYGSKTKNYVLAASSTANSVPSFRALVAADIPNLSANKITSGTLAIEYGGTGTNSINGIINTLGIINPIKSGDTLRFSRSFFVTGYSMTPGQVIFNINFGTQIPLTIDVQGHLNLYYNRTTFMDCWLNNTDHSSGVNFTATCNVIDPSLGLIAVAFTSADGSDLFSGSIYTMHVIDLKFIFSE